MGSEQSASKKSKQNKNNILGDSNVNYEFGGKELSSYKGVKTEYAVSSDNGEDITKDTVNSKNYFLDPISTNEKPNEKNSKNETEGIEIMFVWKEGGNDVFITGSFAGWKQYFMLDKKDDYYYRKIVLSKEKHFFKFIVDKEWKCSNNYESISDEHGNINNFIDLTNMGFGFNELDNSNKQAKTPNQNKKDQQSKNALKKPRNADDYNNYSEIYPDRSELNSETPLIPSSYCNKFSLENNSFQYKIGKNKYIDNLFIEDYYYSNNSSNEICKPPHINV